MLLLLLACQAPVDADYDGVTAELDCDDLDPFVYPGAPDDPADGLDADCDGVDPAWPFVGGWALDLLEASYAGIPLFEPDTEEGGMELGEDLVVQMDVGVTLDPAIAGQAFPIALSLAGAASPMDGDGVVAIWAEGEQYDEQMHIDWVCAVEEEGASLACEGELKALDGSLDALALFTAR